MVHDPHGSWAALKKIAAPDGIGGHYLVREPKLAHYILPNTDKGEVVAVQVWGITDASYFRADHRERIEVTFPGKMKKHFLHPRVVKYPITDTGR